MRIFIIWLLVFWSCLLATVKADEWVFSERHEMGFVITEYESKLPVPDTRSAVIVWGNPQTCAYCKVREDWYNGLSGVEKANLPFKMQFRHKNIPSWITSTPTYHWARGDGTWVWVGNEKFKSIDKFKMLWKSTLRLKGVAKEIEKSVKRAFDNSADRLVPSSQIPPPTSWQKGYPVRGSWWTGCGSWQHMTQGQHAGKFNQYWLVSLSWNELQSLHSDDHEGRVKWDRVVRSGQQGASTAKSWPQQQLQRSRKWRRATRSCPSGACP